MWSPTATEDAHDRSLTIEAFRSLPGRWQEVLWYTVVEGMKPGQVAPHLGLSAVATSQLAFRAREGLRDAWIQAHLRALSEDDDCRWTVERLGAPARHTASKRDTARIENHLEVCTSCAIVAAEASKVSARLSSTMLIAVLGTVGAGSYLGRLRDTPATVAMAPAPDGMTSVPHRQWVRSHPLAQVITMAAAVTVTAGVVLPAAAASLPGSDVGQSAVAVAAPAWSPPELPSPVVPAAPVTAPMMEDIAISEPEFVEAERPPAASRAGGRMPGADAGKQPDAESGTAPVTPPVSTPADPVPEPVGSAEPAETLEPTGEHPDTDATVPKIVSAVTAVSQEFGVRMTVTVSGDVGAELMVTVGKDVRSALVDASGAAVFTLDAHDLLADRHAVIRVGYAGEDRRTLSTTVRALIAHWWKDMLAEQAGFEPATGGHL